MTVVNVADVRVRVHERLVLVRVAVRFRGIDSGRMLMPMIPIVIWFVAYAVSTSRRRASSYTVAPS